MNHPDSRRRAVLRFLAATGSALGGLAIPRLLPAAATATDPALSTLRTAVGGRLVTPSQPGFGAARGALVWNPRVADGRTPRGIVQVQSAEDVVAAIKYARSNGLKVSTRSGGHHYLGASLRADSLVLDLSRLDAVSVDAPRHRVSVQPAVKGGQLLAQLKPHGLAFPVGHCSDVGLGGYLLAGGLGINSAEWGPACLNVQAIELVTAQGEMIRADAQHHTNLFWAARGAGHGFFGVATNFELRAHPLPAGIHVLAASFALHDAAAVALWLTNALQSVHATVEVSFMLGATEPGAPPSATLLAVALAPTPQAARQKLAALRGVPAPLKPIGQILDQASTLEGVHVIMDAGFPMGKRMGADILWTNATPTDLIATLSPFMASAPPSPSAIVLVCAGLKGSIFQMPTAKQSALSISARNYLGAYAFWDRSADDAQHGEWPRKVLHAVSAMNVGGYIGESDVVGGVNRAERCFEPAAWARIKALRKTYDPQGVFHSYLGSS